MDRGEGRNGKSRKISCDMWRLWILPAPKKHEVLTAKEGKVKSLALGEKSWENIWKNEKYFVILQKKICDAWLHSEIRKQAFISLVGTGIASSNQIKV